MSYLAFDLDALNVARDVGNACAIPEERMTHGLLRMWAWCFREKVEHVEPVQVRGFFGTDEAVAALTAFGFLAADGERLRVRGAGRYLRVSEARSEGGKKAAGNLKRGTKRPGEEPEDLPGFAPAGAGREPGPLPGCAPALTPSTEHRAPNTEHQGEEAAPPPASRVWTVKAPDTPAEAWTGDDFWRWAQSRRQAGGLVPEKPPHPRKLSVWWSEARLLCEAPVLKEAFLRFGSDPHWERAAPAFPFGAFLTQWSNFVPQGGLRATAR